MKQYYLAIDIGASSGRGIVGWEEEDGLHTDEVYRFPNQVVVVDNHLMWNLDALVKETKNAIELALRKYKKLESCSIDTWGVDYVLTDSTERIIYSYAYRDQRTDQAIEYTHNIIPFDILFQKTGSQFQKFNTIYQLIDDKLNNRLTNHSQMMMIPEYLNYCLTGKKLAEYTNASTTGLLNAKTDDWDYEIIDQLGLPRSLFTSLAKPGSEVGYLTPKVQTEVGGDVKIVLCATHDTASAVEGIECSEDEAYLSSGTWSLLGVKINKPITTMKALRDNYSNERGPSYVRFQKNIMGMWIVQGLQKQCGIGFGEMVELARKSSYQNTFNVDDPSFLSSLDMTSTIKAWFINHQMTPPITNEDLFNCTYHSLAKSYATALEEIKQITNLEIKRLVVVGGGAKNKYLNELTEQYAHIKVLPLPIEATSIGNLKIQMKGNK